MVLHASQLRNVLKRLVITRSPIVEKATGKSARTGIMKDIRDSNSRMRLLALDCAAGRPGIGYTTVLSHFRY